jgi:hypothetical protein
MSLTGTSSPLPSLIREVRIGLLGSCVHEICIAAGVPSTSQSAPDLKNVRYHSNLPRASQSNGLVFSFSQCLEGGLPFTASRYRRYTADTASPPLPCRSWRARLIAAVVTQCHPTLRCSLILERANTVLHRHTIVKLAISSHPNGQNPIGKRSDWPIHSKNYNYFGKR